MSMCIGDIYEMRYELLMKSCMFYFIDSLLLYSIVNIL
jgi:hypothetical protein